MAGDENKLLLWRLAERRFAQALDHMGIDGDGDHGAKMTRAFLAGEKVEKFFCGENARQELWLAEQYRRFALETQSARRGR